MKKPPLWLIAVFLGLAWIPLSAQVITWGAYAPVNGPYTLTGGGSISTSAVCGANSPAVLATDGGAYASFGVGKTCLNSAFLQFFNAGAGRSVIDGTVADGQFNFQNNARTTTITLNQTSLVTAPTDSTAVDAGSLTRFRSSSTITPATGGVGNCGAAFLAAALTADCTIATLPAGQKLVAVYADVTVGFTCSATCTGTKVVQAGTAAGGTQVLAAGLNVAATGTFGLADADLGSGMTRAAAIQGGLIGSWSSTTIISARFTSGTGNWGTGAATNVNAGTIKFTLITEQVK